MPSLPALPALPRLLRPARLERWLARVLRDLTARVEGSSPPSPDVIVARLSEQLGRPPTRAEMLRLLALLEGLDSALCLSDGELARARAALSSYAQGLRRDAVR